MQSHERLHCQVHVSALLFHMHVFGDWQVPVIATAHPCQHRCNVVDHARSHYQMHSDPFIQYHNPITEDDHPPALQEVAIPYKASVFILGAHTRVPNHLPRFSTSSTDLSLPSSLLQSGRNPTSYPRKHALKRFRLFRLQPRSAGPGIFVAGLAQ